MPVQKDEFGFVVGSKGNFIAKLLSEGVYTGKRLNDLATERYGTDSRGRIRSVIFDLRRRGFVVERDVEDRYYLRKVKEEGEIVEEKPVRPSEEEMPDWLL